jgi:hypothetical protein
MTKRELTIIAIALIIIGALGFIKVQPKIITNTKTKEITKQGETVQLPPKKYTVTEQVPDGIAQAKLEKCRVGLHDAIIRINQIQKQVEFGDKPITKDDTLFNADGLASIYGGCF